MTAEHTYTGKVHDLDEEPPLDALTVWVPADWPVGAEVTVTWTEPPEPSGRWVVDEDGDGSGRRPFWLDSDGIHWTVWGLHEDEFKQAEAALVDPIESDHLPPQMHSVDDIDAWVVHNGYCGPEERSLRRRVIRGTLDALVALDAHGRGPG